MRIGIVFHGPEVFDTGWAARLLVALRGLGEVRALLAGTMGRAALHDSGLLGIGTPGLKPSAGLNSLAPDAEVLLFAQVSKTRESAGAFGAAMAESVKDDLPLIQIECGLKEIRSWRGEAPSMLIAMFVGLGFSRVDTAPITPNLWREGEILWRRIAGAEIGEKVMVNGLNLGTASVREVCIGEVNGQLRHFKGIEVKPHGLEKIERLGPLDLAGAKLSTASTLRRTAFKPRITPVRGSGVVLIDHAGDRSFDLAQECSGAVSIGDDTTAVARDLLGRLGIPVLGIVDGDSDGLSDPSSCIAAPGSLTLLVENDDEFGAEVRAAVFGGGKRIFRDFTAVRAEVVDLAGNRVRSLIDGSGIAGLPRPQ